MSCVQPQTITECVCTFAVLLQPKFLWHILCTARKNNLNEGHVCPSVAYHRLKFWTNPFNNGKGDIH